MKALDKIRAQQAVELTLRGASSDKIAEALGYKDGSAVTRAVNKYLERGGDRNVDEARRLEEARLDLMLMKVWPQIEGTGPGDGGDLKAVQVALKISERRSRLMGLDKPTRVAIGPDEELMSKQMSFNEAMRALSAKEENSGSEELDGALSLPPAEEDAGTA